LIDASLMQLPVAVPTAQHLLETVKLTLLGLLEPR